MTDREKKNEEFKETCNKLASSLLRLKTNAENIKNENSMLRLEVKRLQQERDKAIDGLRWYADYDNYSERTAHNGHDVLADAGEKALNVLSELGVSHETN